MRNALPLVSIILPTYNRAEFLPKAIESVIAQTYTNWELIIWNDGSFDDTEKVIKSFKDNRIHSFYEKNHGMSFALNNAIKNSSGEYVAFLDDDDQWTSNKLSLQMEIFFAYPEFDMVFGNFINIDLAVGHKRLGFEQCSYSMDLLKKQKIIDSVFLINGNFWDSICVNNFIAFDTVILRRPMLTIVGEFNETLRNAMDFEYWWRTALAGMQMAYTDEVVLTRIKPVGSLSSPSKLTYDNKIKALDSCLKYIEKNKRMDLIPSLNHSYSNAWSHLMIFHGDRRDILGIFQAFFQSARYDFNLGSIQILFESIGRFFKND